MAGIKQWSLAHALCNTIFSVDFRTLDTKLLVMESELIHISLMAHSSTVFIEAPNLTLAMQ